MNTVESFGKKGSGNIVIEADNIDALNYLTNEYRNSIDVITIDPPYNTEIPYIGYKDSSYSEGWISFISDRLKIAKELLTPTGVMFINIDENELTGLVDVCRILFGYENVNILIWPKIDPRFDQNRVEKPIYNIKSAHEYVVLCYKDKKNTHFSNMGDGRPMESIITGLGTTSSAKDEIKDLLGDRSAFSTPKPVNLIKEMIRISSKNDSIILDFFAGSGTAGHAVMRLNKEDGGSRKFILVTNSESNICRNVTVPRLKAAIEKEHFEDGFDFITMIG